VQSELLTPLIMRCFMLAIRNGRITMPPPELLKVTKFDVRTKQVETDIDAEQLGIEYIGPLALALSNQEAQGSEGWVSKLGNLAAIYPEALDYVNWDSAIPRWAQAGGVNIADVASQEQLDAKRQVRAKQQQAMQLMQAAQAAGNANKGLSKRPEEGSPAEALMGAGE
jgi:hypothetical protein